MSSDTPIAMALVRAKKRGVFVKIIVDKSQRTDKYSQAKLLEQASIAIIIDQTQGLAHNKVMIIDNEIVVTGSFNFTRAAESRNVENMLFIQSKALAQRYTKHWESRAAVANKKTLPQKFRAFGRRGTRTSI